MEDVFVNQDDPFNVEKSQEGAEKRRIQAYRKLFGSEIGKKVLVDLFKRYKLMEETPQNALDPQFLAYLVGTHAVLKYILSVISKDPFTLKQEMAVNDAL